MLTLEIQDKKQLISKLDSNVSTMRKEVLDKQKVIEDLLSVRQTDTHHSTVDSKIMSELQETQREYQLTTSQLAEHQDQSKRFGVELRVLDAITQDQSSPHDI